MKKMLLYSALLAGSAEASATLPSPDQPPALQDPQNQALQGQQAQVLQPAAFNIRDGLSGTADLVLLDVMREICEDNTPVPQRWNILAEFLCSHPVISVLVTHERFYQSLLPLLRDTYQSNNLDYIERIFERAFDENSTSKARETANYISDLIEDSAEFKRISIFDAATQGCFRIVEKL